MASGDTLVVFTPRAGQPPSSNMATLDLRNSQDVLDFDASTEETINFEGVLPRNYGGGGLTVRIIWMASSATSNNCRWSSAFERHDTATDRDADSLATANTLDAAAPGTTGYTAYSDIAHTSGAQMDSLAAAEHFRLQIKRVAAHANDNMTGDAELVAVEIRET